MLPIGVVIDFVGSGVNGVIPLNLLLARENSGGVAVPVNKNRPFAALLTVVVFKVAVGSAMMVEDRFDKIVVRNKLFRNLRCSSASTVLAEKAFTDELQRRLRRGPLKEQI